MHRQSLVTFALLASVALPAHAQFQPVTCNNSYTQQQEIELGDKVVREVYKTQPVLPDSSPTAQYIRRLGAQLVAVAPNTPGLERQWPFNFHVVASDEINAFALPGGTMFVDLGAIQAAQTEAQLAGVMAHEMSHVIMRHSTCNLIKQQKRSVWYSLGAIGSEIALGNGAGGLAAQGIGAAQNLDFMHMSRGDEKQADLLGVEIVHDAGFDPRGLPQFFEIIVAKYGQGGAQFLSDHPNPGNRTEYLNAEIATLTPLEHPIVSSAAFKTAHASAGQVHALTADELKTGAWKSTGLYASSPGAAARVAYNPDDKVAAGEAAMREAEGTAPPPNAGANGGGVRPTTASTTASSLPSLTAGQLGIGSSLVRVQGNAFAISAPPGWTRKSSVVSGDFPLASPLTLAPLGASGTFGVAYGAILGVVQQGGQGVGDPGILRQAADSIAAQLTRSFNVQPDGIATSMQVAGQPAVGRYFRGSSPVGAQPSTEREWLVVVARPDGDTDALLFIAPGAQFSSMLPLFNKMLGTFSPQ